MLPWRMQLTKQLQSNFWQEPKAACEWTKEERCPDGDLQSKLISLAHIYIYIYIYIYTYMAVLPWQQMYKYLFRSDHSISKKHSCMSYMQDNHHCNICITCVQSRHSDPLCAQDWFLSLWYCCKAQLMFSLLHFSSRSMIALLSVRQTYWASKGQGQGLQ